MLKYSDAWDPGIYFNIFHVICLYIELRNKNKRRLKPNVKMPQSVIISSQELVADFCNPSYSGGRDQEDLGSKPAWATYLKKHITKMGW
jgi:hypothetical protein